MNSEPSQTFRCEMASLMNARHGHIVENEALRFSPCTIVFRPPDALQIFDKDEHQLLSTSAVGGSFKIPILIIGQVLLFFFIFSSKFCYPQTSPAELSSFHFPRRRSPFNFDNPRISDLFVSQF